MKFKKIKIHRAVDKSEFLYSNLSAFLFVFNERLIHAAKIKKGLKKWH
ncbi:hypothetical protein D930_00387 [Enterococcus faecalis KI-6-1-110608-1]|nr:hypothetical protein D930_00387 [Enterococcus faecalis KI-6-1-110608-1]